MKHITSLLAAATLCAGVLIVPPASAAAAKSPAKPAAKAKEVKVGDKAVCCVCAVKEGSKTPEEVKAVIKYKGKTFPFCNLNEKAEFISNPKKYAK